MRPTTLHSACVAVSFACLALLAAPPARADWQKIQQSGSLKVAVYNDFLPPPPPPHTSATAGATPSTAMSATSSAIMSPDAGAIPALPRAMCRRCIRRFSTPRVHASAARAWPCIGARQGHSTSQGPAQQSTATGSASPSSIRPAASVPNGDVGRSGAGASDTRKCARLALSATCRAVRHL
jgi:hypothetical protein